MLQLLKKGFSIFRQQRQEPKFPRHSTIINRTVETASIQTKPAHAGFKSLYFPPVRVGGLLRPYRFDFNRPDDRAQLKQTKYQSLVGFSRLQLLARDFSPKRAIALAMYLLPFPFIIGCDRASQKIPEAKTSAIATLNLLGQTKLPNGLKFQNTEIGGLSGITYDPNKQVYYAISDDRSQKAPARFYTLKIDLKQAIVTPVSVTTLKDETGKTFARAIADPEGIALTNSGTLFISSEGDAKASIPPFIKEFSESGKQLKTLQIPEKFLPSATGKAGVRNNLAFESLTLTPDNQFLFTATEEAMVQDGAPADTRTGSPSRILQYNLSTSKPEQEFLYITEPVAAKPNPPNGLNDNGVVELLALDETHLLSLERSFSKGVGNTIRLFEVSLEGASDIRSIESLSAIDIKTIKPAQKRLVVDFQAFNLPLDNIEGMTFGKQLADGRRSLIFVSDNNFSAAQVTQVWVFAIAL